jgi:tRNA nucleotidyltransferase (CCA-adding enzyme)
MRRPGVAELLRAMPPAAAELTRGVLQAANQRGLAVHLVGGPVRDWLLERPLRDVDLILEPAETSAEELALAAAPPDAKISAHDRFGTVAIETAEARVDVAGARCERYEHAGALPLVEPAALAEDLWRRDFSVNALAIPLSRAARARHAEVVDPTGGLEDLGRRRLRVLHARSFCDDPTRALRAARLAPRLGFALARASRNALQDALREGAFGRVSGDRLRREIVKLFADAGLGLDPVRALRLLSEWHVLGALEPGLALDPRAVPAIRRLGRAVAAPPWRAPRWRTWATGLMVWLAPHPPQLRQRTLRRFAVRGALAERVAGMPRQRERILRSLAKARGRGAIDALLRELGEEELHALHAWAAPALRRRIVRFAVEDRHRRLPVNGVDLAQIGLAGPEIGRALERVRLAVLDGAVTSREEALVLAGEITRRRTLPSRRKPRRLPRRG